MKRNPLVVGGIATLALVVVLLAAGDPGWNKRPVDSRETARMLDAMFPDSVFVKSADELYTDDRERVVQIRHSGKGSFSRSGANEILLVISTLAGASPPTGLSSQYYAAVFDRKAVRPKSAVFSFEAYDSVIAVFRGSSRDYVLLVGVIGDQERERQTGGLYQVGYEWTPVWPEDPGFWSDTKIVMEDGFVQVFVGSSKQGMGEPTHLLRWNPQQEILEIQP